MQIRRIVYPTDFSSCADNALDFAVAIASAFHAHLNLLHIYHETVSTEASIDAMIQENKEKQQKAEKKLKELEECINQKNGDVLVETNIRTGTSHESVLEFIDEKGADLVVIGTHGSTGVREVVFGSFAGGILEYAQCPVLVVPEQAIFEELSSFVFATDHNEIDVTAIKTLSNFALPLKAKIKILHITSEQDPKEEAFKHLVYNSTGGDYEIETIKGRDVSRVIEHYLQERPADLLVMTALKNALFGRLFHPNHTRRMPYHTTLPLLVFHATDECCQKI